MSGISNQVFEEQRKRFRENFGALQQDLVTVINNEGITRARVDRVEGLLARGFWGRLWWFLTGR